MPNGRLRSVFSKNWGADEKKIHIIFNKMDKIDPVADAVTLARLHGLFPDALYISTVSGEGLDQLKAKLPQLISGDRKILHLLLPPARADLAALAHALGEVYEEEYAGSAWNQQHFQLYRSISAGKKITERYLYRYYVSK